MTRQETITELENIRERIDVLLDDLVEKTTDEEFDDEEYTDEEEDEDDFVFGENVRVYTAPGTTPTPVVVANPNVRTYAAPGTTNPVRVVNVPGVGLGITDLPQTAVDEIQAVISKYTR